MDKKQLGNKNSRLTVLSWNARGLSKQTAKVNQLHNLIGKLKEGIDIICIQETWFTDKDRKPKIPGFQEPIQKNRPDRGGGLAIFVKEGIAFQATPTPAYDTIETLAITIIGQNENVSIYNTYCRKPNYHKNYERENPFGQIPNKSIVVGDFNLKNPLWNSQGDFRTDSESIGLIALLENSNMTCVNDGQITHINDTHIGGLDSTIDLAFIPQNLKTRTEFSVLDNSAGSDHLPITVTIDAIITYQPRVIIPKWKIKDATSEQWQVYKQNCLDKIEPSNCNQTTKQKFNTFTDQLNSALEASFKKTKLKEKKFVKQTIWWNEGCEIAIRDREQKRRNYLKNKTEFNKKIWTEARSAAKKLIYKAKENAWQQFCSEIDHTSNSKQVWDFVKKIKNKQSTSPPQFKQGDNLVVDNKMNADILAKHYQYVSSSEGYSQEFLNSECNKRSKLEAPAMIKATMEKDKGIPYNKDFSMAELEMALNQCKNGAPGEDMITYTMLKNLPKESKSTLLKLFNESWHNGITPDNWSEAIIVPILKPGKDKHDPKSYRPISLMSNLSKLMQKLIKFRLSDFLEKNDLLSHFQSGGRPRRSCEDNLIRMHADIIDSWRHKEQTVGLLLDLSAAFDKLWNEGAIGYMHRLGIRGNMLQWIGNFLLTRKIKVRINGQYSDTYQTENGCPQGSVLSPLIFTILMNSLADAIGKHNKPIAIRHKSHLSQFVDDSATWTGHRKLATAIDNTQKTITVIEKWSHTFGFCINPTKTQAIIFTKKYQRRGNEQIDPKPLTIFGQTIQYTNTAKLLGLTFDSNLSWRPHINSIKQRCEKDLNLIRAVRGQTWGTGKKALINIAKALIMSKINYAITVYGSAAESALAPLRVIQNKALKFATGTYKHTPTIPLLVECKELPIQLKIEKAKLNYWARTVGQGYKQPINQAIKKTIEHKKVDKLPYPYSINKLLEEYQLQGIPVQRPQYKLMHNKVEPAIDISLTQTANKNVQPNLAKIIVEEHINKNYADHTQIYTDGSKDPDRNLTGAAAVVTVNGQVHHVLSYKLNHLLSILTCELIAIRQALIWISKQTNGNKNYTILSDSLSSIQAIQSGTSKARPDLIEQVRTILTVIEAKGISVTLTWLPSHVGVIGNERADTAAKKASQSGHTFPMAPHVHELYAYIKDRVKIKFQRIWSHYNVDNGRLPSDLPSKIQIYSNNPRHDKIITRLKLRGSLLDLNSKTGKKCEPCQELENFEHIFFKCKKHSPQINDLESSLFQLGASNITRDFLMDPPKPIATEVRKVMMEFVEKIGYIGKI